MRQRMTWMVAAMALGLTASVAWAQVGGGGADSGGPTGGLTGTARQSDAGGAADPSGGASGTSGAEVSGRAGASGEMEGTTGGQGRAYRAERRTYADDEQADVGDTSRDTARRGTADERMDDRSAAQREAGREALDRGRYADDSRDDFDRDRGDRAARSDRMSDSRDRDRFDQDARGDSDRDRFDQGDREDFDRGRSDRTARSGRTGEDDWRYRRYQGRWWYWTPDNQWVFYENNRWNRLYAPPQGQPNPSERYQDYPRYFEDERYQDRYEQGRRLDDNYRSSSDRYRYDEPDYDRYGDRRGRIGAEGRARVGEGRVGAEIGGRAGEAIGGRAGGRVGAGVGGAIGRALD